MRAQQRPGAAQDVNSRDDYDDPLAPAPPTGRREVPAPGRARPRRSDEAVPEAADTAPLRDALQSDAMQESRLTAHPPVAELDGQEELGPQLAWVSLDAPRGVLVCKNLDLEVTEFIGTIIESRVVRVMKDKDGGVFCASSNRRTSGGPAASAGLARTGRTAASHAGGSPGRRKRRGRSSPTPSPRPGR